MIAAWMLYAVAAATLLALAAAGADRLLRLTGRATRLAWAGALAASLLVPAGAWLVARLAPAVAEGPAAANEAASPAAGTLSLDDLLARATVVVAPASPLAALDRPLLALWLATSLGVAAWLALAVRRLHRARREWRPAVVARTPVLVAGRTGPAVAGVVRPAVVLPEWALAADRETLALMLAHEREHVRAGDPALLAGAAAAVALMPWNPALWWQLRRLRLAVEMDCDRRVLRAHPDVRRYGALLLEVGRRGSGPEGLPLAALASSRSSLERRIRTMTMRRPRHPLLQGTVLAGGAALLVLAACEMPRPTEVSPEGEIPLASITNPGAYDGGGTLTVERVRTALETTMPAALRTEHTGRPHQLWFVADAEGRVLRTEFLKGAQGATTTELRVSDPTIEAPPAGEARTRLRGTRVEGAEAEAGAQVTAGLSPDAIGSIEILKLAPGAVMADSANVIWVQLKPGATLGSAGGAMRMGTRSDASQEGVVVLQGKPTTPGRVMLRRSGVDTVAADRVMLRTGTPDGPKPIVVVDGVITDQAMLDKIDPDRIESVEVLKGVAAEKLYGERAANGVISVTMKK